MAELLSEWMNDTVASVDRAVNQTDAAQGANRAEVVSVLFLVKVLHRAIRILRTEIERGVEAINLNYTDEAKSQLRSLPGLTRHERFSS